MKIFGYTALEGYFVRPTGVGKHIDQLFHGLASTQGIDFSILTARDQLAPDGQAPQGHPLADLPVTSLPYRRRVAEWRWLLSGRPIIDHWVQGTDWVYAPYEIRIPVRSCRYAVTVHSLYQFDRDWPEYSSFAGRKYRLRTRRLFKKCIREADLLLTVSEFVRRQMVQWYGVPQERVVVVGNGVEPEYYAAGLRPPQPPAGGRPYVVCVSGLNQLDGAEYVLTVAAQLKQKDSAIEILIAGHQHEPRYLEQAKEMPNIRLLGYVKKEELAGLMRDSVAMLFLNRYESFGIGAAEAMAAGTPVIGTNFTAVPEVVGGAGILADVSKPAEIAEQIIDMARSDALRQKYIALGAQRAPSFTWAACVDRLLAAFRA